MDDGEVHVQLLRHFKLGSMKIDDACPRGSVLGSTSGPVSIAKTKVDEGTSFRNKPNVAGKGHAWMFDLDYLTNSMNYEPVSVENQANKSTGPKEDNNSAGIQANDDQSANSEEIDLHEEHFVLPIWSAYLTIFKSSGDKIEKNTNFKTCEKPVSQVEQIFLEELEKLKRQEKKLMMQLNHLGRKLLMIFRMLTLAVLTYLILSTPLSTAGPSRAFNDGELSYLDDPSMPHLEDIYTSPSEWIFTDSSYDDEGVNGLLLIWVSLKDLGVTLLPYSLRSLPEMFSVQWKMTAARTLRRILSFKVTTLLLPQRMMMILLSGILILMLRLPENKPKPQANKKDKSKGKVDKNKKVVPYQPKPKHNPLKRKENPNKD
nr:hypothetical protein [Tanacetum cinerariifolium]